MTYHDPEGQIVGLLAQRLLLWRCDPQGQRDYASPGWLAFTGYAAHQALGLAWVEAIHPGDREPCLAAWRAAIPAQAPFALQYRLRRHDGAYCPMLDHAVPLADAEGVFRGYAGSSVPQEVVVPEGTAGAPARAAAPLPLGLHEVALNTLQTVVSLLELKARRLESPAAAEQLRSVGRYVLSVGIVQQQLFGREKGGKVELGGYLALLAQRLVEAHERLGIRVEAEVEPVRVATTRAVAMGMIMSELVANSLQHAFPGRGGGTIRVVTRPLEGGGAEVVVADDGVGMHPALYPAGRANSMGLRLVAALARQARATVALSARRGVRFTFALPEHEAASPAPGARARRRAG